MTDFEACRPEAFTADKLVQSSSLGEKRMANPAARPEPATACEVRISAPRERFQFVERWSALIMFRGWMRHGFPST